MSPTTRRGKLISNQEPTHGLPYFNTSLLYPGTARSGSATRTAGSSTGPAWITPTSRLLRNFHIHGSQTVQFRAEAFNVFNHAQFNNPSGNWNNTSTFGIVTSANDPRIMQLAVKYQF